MGPRRRAAASLAAVAALAGCLAAEQDPGPPAAAALLDASDRITSCRDVGAFIPVDRDRVARALPPGFRAQEASVPGTPVPTGKAVVIMTAIRCERSALEGGPFGYAELLVPVEPPDAPVGAEIADADHAWSPVWYYDAPATAALLAGAGARVAEVAIANTGSAAAGAPTGSALVENGEGQLFVFEVAGPVAQEASPGAFVQWNVPDGGGLFYQRIDVTADSFRLSKLVACSVRAGTPAYELLGSEDCATADAMGWVAEGIDADVRYRRIE